MNHTTQICREALGPVFTSVGLVFMSLIIVLSLLGNALVCTAVARFRYLQTNSNCLVFSLAVSDIMVACLVVPFDIVYWLHFPLWPLGGYACNLWNSLFFLFLTASVLNLLAISADRFVAIVFALRYKSLVAMPVVKVTIASIWAYSAVIGVTLFFMLVPPQSAVYTFNLDPSLHGFLLVGNVLVPFLLMMALYFKIYLIARQHTMRIGIAAINPAFPSVRNVIGRELRVAKALGIVLVTFVLCWLPFEVVNVMILVDDGVETCAVELADTIGCWLAYLQTAVNPIIYACANAEFRRAFRKILCLKSGGLTTDTFHSTNNQSVGVKVNESSKENSLQPEQQG